MFGRTTLSVVATVVAFGSVFGSPAAAHSRGATVTHLEMDGRADNPLGVDDTAPSLSWRVRRAPDGWAQAAYQIRAASSREQLARGAHLWSTGKVHSSAMTDVRWAGRALRSRQEVVWQVRVWNRRGGVTPWSRPASWEMGLLERSDWGKARWIEYPGRALSDPLPIFARSYTVERHRAPIAKARLHLSGLGIQRAELNGRRVTGEVLAPGNSNYQLSAEYRTYDVTRLVRPGANTVGVELGNGTALVTRSVTNPATGRTAPYAWWQSQFKGSGSLAAPAAAGDTAVKVDSVADYHVGGTINIDTGDGGNRLESRTITAIGTAGAGGTGITFEPALECSALRRRRGHRLGQPDRQHRPERRGRRHAAHDRAARDHAGRRLGRHDRQRPLVEGGARPDRVRHVVLGIRLRLAPRTAGLDPAWRRSERHGKAS